MGVGVLLQGTRGLPLPDHLARRGGPPRTQTRAGERGSAELAPVQSAARDNHDPSQDLGKGWGIGKEAPQFYIGWCCDGRDDLTIRKEEVLYVMFYSLWNRSAREETGHRSPRNPLLRSQVC